jgi:hypothetical protein
MEDPGSAGVKRAEDNLALSLALVEAGDDSRFNNPILANNTTPSVRSLSSA